MHGLHGTHPLVLAFGYLDDTDTQSNESVQSVEFLERSEKSVPKKEYRI